MCVHVVWSLSRLEVGILRGSEGDPLGILGGSWQFIGDPCFCTECFAQGKLHYARGSSACTYPLYNIKKGNCKSMGVFLEVARSLELYHAFVRLFLKPALGAVLSLFVRPRSFC